VSETRKFLVDGRSEEIAWRRTPEGALVVRGPQGEERIEIARIDAHTLAVTRAGGERLLAHVARDGDRTHVSLRGRAFVVQRPKAGAPRARARAGHDPGLEAPMPGQVRAIAVAVGDSVAEGDTLLVLEAMKMELRIRAPHAGRVERVACQVGDVVDRGQVLVELEIAPD
jgi:3-methylcrotonyl-CoA carboxylase alpha subunit